MTRLTPVRADNHEGLAIADIEQRHRAKLPSVAAAGGEQQRWQPSTETHAAGGSSVCHKVEPVGDAAPHTSEPAGAANPLNHVHIARWHGPIVPREAGVDKGGTRRGDAAQAAR